MATLEISGHHVQVDDAFKSLSPEDQQKTVNEIAQSLGIQDQGASQANADMSAMTQQAGAGQSANPDRTDNLIRANMEARKIDTMRGDGAFGDASKSVDPLMGWSDELYSNTLGAGMRMMRDGVGYSEAAQREQMLQEALKRNREDRSPVASTIGSVAGGLVGGGTLTKGGVTLAGKSIPMLGKTIPAMIEGGAYGAVQGSGDAKSGDKLAGAGRGAAIGAVTAGLVSKAGDVIAKRAASKAASQAAPAADQLKSQASGIYDQAYKSGTQITPQGTTRLVDNMTIAAGRPNVNSRPETFGLLDDLQAIKGQPMDIEAFHELRKQVNSALASAKPEDARVLSKMKDILDASDNWMTPAHVTNGKQGLQLLKEANAIYARGMKTGKLETMLDLADVKSARYTQSGMANALRDKASNLYTKIQNGTEKGFTAQEIAIVRGLAKGEHSGVVKTWLAKFAPRGPVSGGIGAGIGGTVGSFIGGPVGGAIGMAVPGSVGYVAGRSVDKAATKMALGLRDLAARGGSAIPQSVINKLAKYATPAAITATGLLSPRQQPLPQKAR